MTPPSTREMRVADILTSRPDGWRSRDSHKRGATRKILW
jgi:hypothetical protein